MMINGIPFLDQPLCSLFRPELERFEKNAWFISLEGEHLDAVVKGKPHFSKLYEYGRKLKDALELDLNTIVLFKPVRHLTECEFKIISDEVMEHERAYHTISRSNGVEVHELLEDYDDTGL
jgi:hypothetical protein